MCTQRCLFWKICSRSKSTAKKDMKEAFTTSHPYNRLRSTMWTRTKSQKTTLDTYNSTQREKRSVRFQLSTFYCQLSTVNFRLSTFNFLLFTFYFRLSKYLHQKNRWDANLLFVHTFFLLQWMNECCDSLLSFVHTHTHILIYIYILYVYR